MRRHGWQIPYHPLQVVAIAVVLALEFAFYVFFAPFVGKKLFQYAVMGIYTPLVMCVICLYIWCAAIDPGDPGVFKSKKYLPTTDIKKKSYIEKSKKGDLEAIHRAHYASSENKSQDDGICSIATKANSSSWVDSLVLCPVTLLHNRCASKKESCEYQMSEDGMFYCSLCEVEVLEYTKHCRVCDKCVDNFDHHCRWLNNCIGRKNYRGFFILVVSALLLASCPVLAMVATLPLVQLFLFHVLLIKKGISTYDYIMALRESDQQSVDHQSTQTTSVSSFTGLSATSSLNALHPGGWCTPPRFFLENQYGVIPQEINMPVNSAVKMMIPEESARRRNAVKISPWTLARMNAEEVSKAAAEARKKSSIMQPVARSETSLEKEFGRSSFGRDDNRRKANKRGKLPMDLPLHPPARISTSPVDITESGIVPSTSLASLQLEARRAFRPRRDIFSAAIGVSSPDNSLHSPEFLPFRISYSGAEESQFLPDVPSTSAASQKGIQLFRSTSDSFDASGGGDNDMVPYKIVHRSLNWD